VIPLALSYSYSISDRLSMYGFEGNTATLEIEFVISYENRDVKYFINGNQIKFVLTRFQ